MILPRDIVINATVHAVTRLASSPSALTDRADQCESINDCRTLWDIIWSCLATILLCVWVSIHPNVPQLYPPRKHFRDKLVDKTKEYLDRVGVALLALLAPEFIFVWALRQWLNARALARKCQQAADWAGERQQDGKNPGEKQPPKDETGAKTQLRRTEPGGRETNRTRNPNDRSQLQCSQSEVGDTGGRRCQNSLTSGQPTPPTGMITSAIDVGVWLIPGTQGPWLKKWTTTHGFFILMGGYHCFDDDNNPYVYLTPDNVLFLIADGLLDAPSKEEIEDRSKSDFFAKAIVLGQTLWFVMQFIARLIEHLPITELEVATVAYTIPILGIYLCWWNKPLGVSQPIRVRESLMGRLYDAGPQSLWRSFVASLTGWEEHQSNRSRVPRFSAGRPSWVHMSEADLAGAIITVLFGAVHFSAWSFDFPSRTERLVWRIGSLITTASPIAWIIVYSFSLVNTKWLVLLVRAWEVREQLVREQLVELREQPVREQRVLVELREQLVELREQRVREQEREVREREELALLELALLEQRREQRTLRTIILISVIVVPLYLIGRALLLVIAVMSLQSLPYGAYRAVRWTTFIPHI